MSKWIVGAAADSSAKPNLTDRMAGNFRKAMGITAKEPDTAKRLPPDYEASQANAQSAANMVQIGFTAFAVSAYIRSSLCPDLKSYSPQPMHLTAQVRPVIAATKSASVKLVSTRSVFSVLAVSSIDCSWLAALHPHFDCLLTVMRGSSGLLPHLALTSLQADVKLGQPAQGPHVTPAARGQFILHCTQREIASLSAPGRSSPEGTVQVWHALLHTGLFGPKQSSCS